MTKEQLQNFKWQPPPENPPVVTPRDIYVVRAGREGRENDVWDEIRYALKDFDIIDFRPLQKGDTALSYGTPMMTFEVTVGDPIDKSPRFIVKKKRVFTDTERLNYLMLQNKAQYRWGQTRGDIDDFLRIRLENGLTIE